MTLSEINRVRFGLFVMFLGATMGGWTVFLWLLLVAGVFHYYFKEKEFHYYFKEKEFHYYFKEKEYEEKYGNILGN